MYTVKQISKPGHGFAILNDQGLMTDWRVNEMQAIHRAAQLDALTVDGKLVADPAIKFQLLRIVRGDKVARVSYSIGNHVSFEACVTIHAKDYGNQLREIFEAAQNHSEYETDYVVSDVLRIFPGSPYYMAAMKAATEAAAKDATRIAKRLAKKAK